MRTNNRWGRETVRRHKQRKKQVQNVLKMNKSLPLQKNQLNNWADVVNPYHGHDTCDGAEKTSLVWLGKIREDFSDFSNTKKVKFLENMISEAYGSFHKGYQRTIIEELKTSFIGLPYYVKDLISKLENKYHDLNINIICTCRSRLPEETDVSNITMETKVVDYIANPYLGETTCKGAEKSSLFWLSLIRETYDHLSNRKKYDFVEDMVLQAHGCLHNDYHTKIINALKCGQGNDMIDRYISHLAQEYRRLNKKFVCTCDRQSELTNTTINTEEACGSGLNEKLLHSKNAKKPFEIPDSPETNTKVDTETDFTYEDILDIFELHD